MIFDENEKYDLYDVDLIQAIQKLMIETIYDTTNLIYISQIRETKSNDDLMIINEIDQSENSFVLLSQFEKNPANDFEQQMFISLDQ